MTAILRPAQSLDAGAVGAILSGYVAETPWLPRLHSQAEDLALCAQMITSGWVTVACAPNIRGFLTLRNNEVLSLYVAGPDRRLGLGHSLLSYAKTRHTQLRLWTHQANTQAQAFYHREGFAETRRTNGAANDDGLPDIEYLWERSPAA